MCINQQPAPTEIGDSDRNITGKKQRVGRKDGRRTKLKWNGAWPGRGLRAAYIGTNQTYLGLIVNISPIPFTTVFFPRRIKKERAVHPDTPTYLRLDKESDLFFPAYSGPELEGDERQ